MKAIIASLTFSACLLLPGTNAAFATGQPGAPGLTCGSGSSTALTPGHAGSTSNTGSPFSPNGKSGTVYANPGVVPANASPNAISQYDISCFHYTASQTP